MSEHNRSSWLYEYLLELVEVDERERRREIAREREELEVLRFRRELDEYCG